MRNTHIVVFLNFCCMNNLTFDILHYILLIKHLHQHPIHELCVLKSGVLHVIEYFYRATMAFLFN